MNDVAGAADATTGDGGAAAVHTANLLDGGAPNPAPTNAEPTGDTGSVTPENGTDTAANGQGGGDPPKQDTQAIDWRHEFAEGLEDKDKEAWLNESARSENKQALAKRFLDMRRSQSKAITIPAEDDPEREAKMGDIYGKLGRPEAPDKYELNWDGPEPLSETETAAFDEFRQVHFRNGGTQKQLDDYVKWETQQRRVQTEAFKARAEDISSEHMATLKGVWGSDFDQNKAVYNTTVRHYMGEDTDAFAQLQLADGTPAANHPIIARAFAKVGRERASDDFDYTPMNADRKEDAAAKLKALQQDMITKGIRPGMPGYPQDDFDRLHQQVAATRKRSPNDRFARSA